MGDQPPLSAVVTFGELVRPLLGGVSIGSISVRETLLGNEKILKVTCLCDQCVTSGQKKTLAFKKARDSNPNK